MKIAILFSILALASAKVVLENELFEASPVLVEEPMQAEDFQEEGFEPITKYYHETIGFKAAAEIKAAEESMNFDGSRIVGGSAANLGAYPHLGGLVIAMMTGGTSVCGSSLISANRCVTAAHCWNDGRNQARQFTVVLGSITLFSGGTRIATTNVRMHPNWNPNTISNDVAVILMGVNVGTTNNVRPIALASGTNNYAGSWAWAAGFGAQADGAGIGTGQRKHHVNLQVITNAVCAQTFGGSIIASTLCTSGAGGRGTCGGDSGGPLEVTVGNVRTLIGITSFGAAAGCQRGFPAAFARVTSFNAWIRSI